MSLRTFILCHVALTSLAACGAHATHAKTTCPVKCFGIRADAQRGEVAIKSAVAHDDHHWVALASDSECRARGGAPL